MVSAAVEGETSALHNSHAWKTQQPTGARLSLLQMEWVVQKSRCALGYFIGSRGTYLLLCSFGGMDKLFHDAPCNYSQGRSNPRSAENHRTTLVSKNAAPFLRGVVLTWPGLIAAAVGFLPGTVCHTWRIWKVQSDPESSSLVTKLPDLALQYFTQELKWGKKTSPCNTAAPLGLDDRKCIWSIGQIFDEH